MPSTEIQKRVIDNLLEEIDSLKQQNAELREGAVVHKGYGKLILFGEHFVVYKVPALVAAVAAFTDATAELVEQPGVQMIDNRPAVPGYKTKKKDEQDEATELVLKHLGFDSAKRGVKITMGGDLCCVSGIGASASSCIAIARAVSTAMGQNLSEEEINGAGYEGEKGYHGTPSGIDNTSACYGGILKFQRTEGDPTFEMQSLPQKCCIVYASTGITASTTEVVGDVRAKKEADPAWWDGLMDKYKSIVTEAETALQKGDWKRLGELCDKNHTLCQDLTVSCSELDELVDIARSAGAWGAKMSGTGRGGLMLAITPGEDLAKKVAAALEQKAPQVWMTTLQ
jgi:mevalonate kinase